MREIYKDTGISKNIYYFGARYYDPRISNWISTDPALGEYMPGSEQLFFPEEVLNPYKQLKGMGGIYNAKNLNLYHYAGLNPIKLIDPNGKHTKGNHEKITTEALSSMVSQTALAILIEANKLVDEEQGSSPIQANKHATRGVEKTILDIPYFAKIVIMESKESAMLGTENYIKNQIATAADLAVEGDYEGALKALGGATHAKQDVLEHAFSEWAFRNLAESVILSPRSMAIHGASDLYLPDDELQRNVGATRDVFSEFRNIVGDEVYKNTVNYGQSTIESN